LGLRRGDGHKRHELGRIRGWLAPLPVLVILGINLSLYSLPGTASRQALTAELAQHERLRTRLNEAGVEAVVGDFWLVYHLNFDSLRKLAAVPFQRHSDYYDLPQRLPVQGLRWAMVARDEDELMERAERAGVHGSIVDFEGLKIFLPDPPASDLATGELLKAVRGPL
jgi:hypothetical protein